MGDNAENYDWPNMPTTRWTAGSFQEVAWHVHANHAGGYLYRLCKMPEGGISEVTEECFQQTPLEFAGGKQWVEYRIDKFTGKRTKVKPRQTRSGTYPEGSMWRANPLLPEREAGGSQDYGIGHVIDYVEVPADLEPGKYVVSHRSNTSTAKIPIIVFPNISHCPFFRWDCKCNAQIWTSCATVKIVQRPGGKW